jgi:NADPH-dependent glutamate synthase beta subunit-like oxidoreductase/NAD(P)H-flavin reductase
MPLGVSDFTYADLYQPERLQALSAAFDAYFQRRDDELFERFEAYRASKGQGMEPTAISDLLVDAAPLVGEFLAQLFGVEQERGQALAAAQEEFATVFAFRKLVANVGKRFDRNDLGQRTGAQLQADLDSLRRAAFADIAEDGDLERASARLATRLEELAQALRASGSQQQPAVPPDEKTVDALRARISADTDAARRFAGALQEPTALAFVERLVQSVERWTYAALHDPELRARVDAWVSFKQPHRLNFSQLVAFETHTDGSHPSLAIAEQDRRLRNGFALTDRRYGAREVNHEVNHCIYCHDRDRDSCSKGMRKKDGSLRHNPLDVTLTGCPLEEKISEAHLLKRAGDNLAALAVIMVDNPLVPGTGHRICNDCMKACIYQKVEPVNIPQIETNVLTDVLFMPFGFEIYGLLTRWNPLNVKRPYLLPYNGKNVLVVGLGPAGYTLSHFLLNEGFAVTGIDALKIEPLPVALTGDTTTPPVPVRDFATLHEELDARTMAGFGGVAEYGITVRWDKNFLKVVYLTLARQNCFSYYGGVRFGGTLSVDDAWALGFDHIAIASGAGEPSVIGIKGNLLRGVRKASDFLMALQLTGAAKRDSLANLQVRLPAAVIGGGLTAIDTATELLAYYPVQVEKIEGRYQQLIVRFGEQQVRSRYTAQEQEILDEFLAHARAIRAEREEAQREGRQPDLLALVRKWGGVTIFYRKGLNDSPAYRQNHEEVQKALEEGMVFAPGMSPLEAIADVHGHLAAVRFERREQRDGAWHAAGECVVAVRSLLVAAGTSPNVIYEREHPGTFAMEGKFFRHFERGTGAHAADLIAVDEPAVPKVARPAPFTSYQKDGRYITFFGDNHPVYAGNVVKAMASAKDGYPYIVALFENELNGLSANTQSERDQALTRFRERLDSQLLARVEAVNRLTPTIVEVLVRAPMQARKFQPGQFYRVQNLETLAPVVEDTRLVAEGLALTGAWVDREQGLISLITLEMGASSRLCALWQPGESLVVMGPTGTATNIPRNSLVLLVGGGLGNAVLFSIGRAMREAGNRVLYFAGYRKPEDRYRIEEIEAASDIVVWAVDPGPGVTPLAKTRPQDKSCVANIVEAMVAYGRGELGPTPIALDQIEHLMVIGSDRMMAAVKNARFGALRSFLKPDHIALGSINSPMQCMMKGVCAQCLCRHVDPATGKETFVYSCFNQDQALDEVDFPHLDARLRQNAVQEKLADQWLDYLLEHYHGPRV